MGRLYLFFVSIIGLILLLLLSLNSTVRGSQLTNFYFPAAASKKSFSRSSSVILSPLHTASATNNIPAKAIAISGTVAYIGADTNLILVDITNPTAPTEITSISLATSGSEIIDLQIQSNYLYVGDKNAGLKILSLSNPTSPVQVGFVSLPTLTPIERVVVKGNYGYVEGINLVIISITNPSNPTLVGTFLKKNAYSYGFDVEGNYAYLATGSELETISLSSPSSPTLVGSFSSSFPVDVDVVGSYAYLADYLQGLKVVSIASPTSPTLVGSVDVGTYSGYVVASGIYLYMCNAHYALDGIVDLKVLSVANLTTPTVLGSLSMSEGCNKLIVKGQYIYLANNTGLMIISVAIPSNPVIVGSYLTQPITCYTLTISATPSNAGTVSSTPAPNCQGNQYIQGTIVSLSAIANPGYVFSQWSGSASSNANPLMLTMNGNSSITANFNLVASTNTPTPVPGSIIRVSVASDGSQANSDSYYPSISADGRYVGFTSDASNLVSGDTNGIGDTFIHDLNTGQTTRVSIASNGTQGNDRSIMPSISADGRYIAFQSLANTLVSGDTNTNKDIFVRDQYTSQTTRVSVASDGTQANNGSSISTFFGNGRYVVFQSSATNLVSGTTTNFPNIFIHDQITGENTRIPVASDDEPDNYAFSISADGRYVAFPSSTSNLVSGDTNGVADIFVYDRNTSQIERVSIASNGTQANSYSFYPTISADGRYVEFLSSASNLVSGDTNGVADVFVHDRNTGQTTRVSVASDGTQSNSHSFGNELLIFQTMSADGRYVAFQSDASNLVAGDTNGVTDIFVHDMITGKTTRVSVAADGSQSDGHSYYPSISADGRYIAFASDANNLVSPDFNGHSDVFVYDQGAQGQPPTNTPTPLLTATSTSTPVPPTSTSTPVPTPTSTLVPGAKAWTLMFYLAGDNDLDEGNIPTTIQQYLDHLKKFIQRPDINIAVMYDGIEHGDSGYYAISDNVTFISKGELNTGDPATLVDFVDWARTTFPSKHTALIIFDHGHGLTGVARDDSATSLFGCHPFVLYDCLKMKDLSTASSQIVAHQGKIDVLFMQACVMASIEAAYQLKDLADYYVASEQTAWYGPLDFPTSITANTDPEALALGIENEYHSSVSNPHTISVARLSKVSDLTTKVSALAKLLKNRLTDIQNVQGQVQHFDSNDDNKIDLNDELIDLYDFARLMKSTTSSQEIKDAATAVMDIISDDPDPAKRYILDKQSISGTAYNYVWHLEHSYGVMIFKTAIERSFYKGENLDFATGTIWSSMSTNTAISSANIATDTIEWGPMLVEYVKQTNPNAPDDPVPPNLIAPLIPPQNIYLPIILRP